MDEQEIKLDKCSFCGWTDGEHAPGCPYDPDIIDMEPTEEKDDAHYSFENQGL